MALTFAHDPILDKTFNLETWFMWRPKKLAMLENYGGFAEGFSP
jgi:hypothetical protein